MKQRLIIVDNFYKDPYQAREFALQCQYTAVEGHTYPGENSVEALNPPGQLAAFKKILGPQYELSRIALAGHFRVSMASDTYEQDVHVDPSNDPNDMLWAGVLYLNTPEQCLREDGTTRDGTLLWRHKELGIESVPTSSEEGRALGFKNYAEVRDQLIYQDGHDRSKWELLYRVPMKFNRMVFFRPIDWHSHGENFGNTRETARLVQIFFFRKQVS